MRAYYNEIDPYAAAWLRNLIAAGHLPEGDVDERSIVDVRPGELRSYRSCHFFAGIGGWPYALRLAGWPDDKSVWTGSCPCQPLSSAGQRRGHADERHLWPAFQSLIAQCKPSVVFCEQVASKDGREWFSAVRADLEGCGYAVGAANLPACGVGAPHIRQRLWFVAHTSVERRQQDARGALADEATHGGQSDADHQPTGIGATGELADADPARCGTGRAGEAGDDGAARLELAGLRADGMEHATRDGREQRGAESSRRSVEPRCGNGTMVNSEGEQVGFPGRARQPRSTPWDDLVWLPCTDGKARPTQPGLFPLAHGVPGRVGRLRAYGNAIVAPLGAEFIKAFMEA